MNDQVDRFLDEWSLTFARNWSGFWIGWERTWIRTIPAVRKSAEKGISEILKWLNPLRQPLPFAERLKLAQELLARGDEAAAERIARSSGRSPGKPRTDASTLAIRALSLQLKNDWSYRRVANEVNPCRHERPNQEIACEKCGENIRMAVMRLKSLLQRYGSWADPPARLAPESKRGK